jgi:ATP-dependent protease ClpP protease subunit
MSRASGIHYLYKNHTYKLKHKKHLHGKKRKLENILDTIVNNDSDSDNSDQEFNDDEFYHDDDVSCKDNRIYFKTAITEDSVEKLIKIIESKNQMFKKISTHKMILTANPKPLYLHITSYGGDLLASFRAIDAIRRSEIPIYTVVDGYAASGATLMSIVGHKRYMTPNSYMLIHQLSAGAIGKYWELKDECDNCETWMKDIYALYTKHSQMTDRELKDYLSHDLLWKAGECIEKGLVDEVYEHDMY